MTSFNGKKWLRRIAEVADNVEILNQGIWHTASDGTNKMPQKARQCPGGDGVAAPITQQDPRTRSPSATSILHRTERRCYFTWSWTAKRFCRSYFRCPRKKDQRSEGSGRWMTPRSPGLDHRVCGHGFTKSPSVHRHLRIVGQERQLRLPSEGTAKWSTGRAGADIQDAFVSSGGGGRRMGIARFRMVRFLHYHNQPRFRFSMLPKSRCIPEGGGGCKPEELHTTIFLFRQELEFFSSANIERGLNFAIRNPIKRIKKVADSHARRHGPPCRGKASLLK